MEQSESAAAAAAAARESRTKRIDVSDERKMELQKKLAAVRGRQARPGPSPSVGLDVTSATLPNPSPQPLRHEDNASELQERDQKPVVDWVAVPDPEIARVSSLYARPTYVMQSMHPPVEFWLEADDPDLGLKLQAGGVVAAVSARSMGAVNGVTTAHTLVMVGDTNVQATTPAADIIALVESRPVLLKFKGGQMSTPKRITFDKADAELDAHGWPSGKTITGQTPKLYPCCRLKVDELGTIGGVGMRLYFFLLHFLCTAFSVMAVLTTPSIVLLKRDSMYNHSQADRYRTTLAETTLGNVKLTFEELQSGSVMSHSLWTISAIEAFGSLIMLMMALRASKSMAKLVEDVDKSAVTMADYTIMVEPQVPWEKYKAVGKHQQLVDDLQKAIEMALPNAQLAQIMDTPCMWVAWNDRQKVFLWNAKRATLSKLESALAMAYASGDTKVVEGVLDDLEKVNKQICDVNAKTARVPVFVFVTFNLVEHYEDALTMKELDVAGIKCNLRQAPEPESVKWENLEYSARQRRWRKRIIYFFTLLALAIGAFVIAYANFLKIGTKYTDFCSEVIGEDMKVEFDAVCPGAVYNDSDWSPGSASDLAALYQNMFTAVHDHDGDLYVAYEGDAGPESVGSTEEDLPFRVCDDGERARTGSPCHYIDTGLEDTTAYLMARGDLDAMCYACICTLDSVEDSMRTPLEDYFTANPTYLDQCYAESGAEPDVSTCEAVDLSDASNAQANCDSAGCIYKKSHAESYCEEIDTVEFLASLWGYIATFIVVIINQVLKQGMTRSAGFARAHTIENEMVSTSIRVYICQLLNTAILMLILKSDLGIFRALPGEHYITVNAKWYAEVGAPLIQTMVIQFMTSPAVQLFTVALNKFLANRAAKKALTQNELNAAKAPHNFELAAGYGEVLLKASVTLIFGAGIPLLYHVAAIGFFIRAAVEKWIIVKVTRKPPLYSKELFSSFDELFSLLLLAHIAMATYFIASAGGLTPTTTHIFLDELFFDSNVPMHHHIWPVFCAFLLVLVGVSWKLLSGSQSEDTDEATLEAIPSFEDSYRTGLIVNEDDDYTMDQYENLVELEEAFEKALDEAQAQGRAPFGPENEALFRRTRDAVGAVPGEGWQIEKKNLTKASKPRGNEQRRSVPAALPYRP